MKKTISQNKFLNFTISFLFLLLTLFLLTSCKENNLNAEFIRFSIGARESDYYLDFTVKINNQTGDTIYIETKDVYISINNNLIEDVSFLSETEETFLTYPTINNNDSLTLRFRICTNINNKDYNSIIVKYKNITLVNDNIFISDGNKKTRQ